MLDIEDKFSSCKLTHFTLTLIKTVNFVTNLSNNTIINFTRYGLMLLQKWRSYVKQYFEFR